MKDSSNMFYGATPIIFENAKMLRKNMTKHEKLLWEELRSNRLLGLRFKSQHPISVFIADFYCHKLKLIIEIDGKSHNSLDQSDYDQGRSYEMGRFGIKVLRFTNEKIETGLQSVLAAIKRCCHEMEKD